MSDDDPLLPFQKAWPGFVDHAREIFAAAGVDPGQNPALLDEVIETLARKMRDLSRTHGLSWERLRLYDEQKRSLVEHLLRKKAAGLVHGTAPKVDN